jgi:hypothetical protein
MMYQVSQCSFFFRVGIALFALLLLGMLVFVALQSAGVVWLHVLLPVFQSHGSSFLAGSDPLGGN